MPRYFFNVFASEDIFDEVGTELPSGKEARRRMVLIALEIVEKFKISPSDIWQMEALDEAGAMVGTMDFGIEDRSRRSVQSRS